jgi:hypothetical protein
MMASIHKLPNDLFHLLATYLVGGNDAEKRFFRFSLDWRNFMNANKKHFGELKKHNQIIALDLKYAMKFNSCPRFRRLILNLIVAPAEQLQLNFTEPIYQTKDLAFPDSVNAIYVQGSISERKDMDDRLALWNCKILSVLQDVSGPMQYFTLEFPDDSSRNILEEVEFSSIHPRNYQVLSHLKSVSISKTRIITAVSCFRNVKKLKFHGCPCITDVSCLKEVYDLELSWCNGITDVSSLGKVYRLNLSESENIKSVSALGNVHELNLIGAEGLEMSPP